MLFLRCRPLGGWKIWFVAALDIHLGFCRACRRELHGALYRMASLRGEEAAGARLHLLRWQRRLRQMEILLAPGEDAPAQNFVLMRVIEAVQWLGSLTAPSLRFVWNPDAWPVIETRGDPRALGKALLALGQRWQQAGAAEVRLMLDAGHPVNTPVHGQVRDRALWLELFPLGLHSAPLSPMEQELDLLRRAGALQLVVAEEVSGLRICLPQLTRIRRASQPARPRGAQAPVRLLALSPDAGLSEWVRDRLGRQKCFSTQVQTWREARLLLGVRNYSLIIYDWNWPPSLPGAAIYWLLRHRPECLRQCLILADPLPPPDFLKLMEHYGLIWAPTPLNASALENACGRIFANSAEITRPLPTAPWSPSA